MCRIKMSYWLSIWQIEANRTVLQFVWENNRIKCGFADKNTDNSGRIHFGAPFISGSQHFHHFNNGLHSLEPLFKSVFCMWHVDWRPILPLVMPFFAHFFSFWRKFTRIENFDTFTWAVVPRPLFLARSHPIVDDFDDSIDTVIVPSQLF